MCLRELGSEDTKRIDLHRVEKSSGRLSRCQKYTLHFCSMEFLNEMNKFQVGLLGRDAVYCVVVGY
jgi:hypothetical protein